MKFLSLSFFILAFFATFVLSTPGNDPNSSESNESNESKPRCLTNEVFKCTEEATCENLQTLDTLTIQKTCSCICKPGLVRLNGVCSLPIKCVHMRNKRSKAGSSECKDPNEQYMYCGSKCPARCGDKPGSRVCTTDCVKGCFCKKGYVLNSSNKCVLPNKC